MATLCLPILVISVQQNAVVMTLPPFLDAHSPASTTAAGHHALRQLPSRMIRARV